MEEDWPAARRQERLREIQEPVEALVRTARATKRDAAVSTWVKRMRALADEVLETAKQIIEDQSTDYTLDEVERSWTCCPSAASKSGSSSRRARRMALVAIRSSSRCSGRCLGRSRHR
jgi:hypothetical protein